MGWISQKTQLYNPFLPLDSHRMFWLLNRIQMPHCLMLGRSFGFAFHMEIWCRFCNNPGPWTTSEPLEWRRFRPHSNSSSSLRACPHIHLLVIWCWHKTGDIYESKRCHSIDPFQSQHWSTSSRRNRCWETSRWPGAFDAVHLTNKNIPYFYILGLKTSFPWGFSSD